ncbi:MAG: sigma-70 family RNA polymerase sigma factor [Thermoanaerobaculia bacterium]
MSFLRLAMASAPAGAAPLAVASSAGVSSIAPADLATQEFARFYEATKMALRRYLAAAARDPAVADDLTQEAFLRLYTARIAFADDAHRRNYLFRIGSNLLRDHWRARRRATLPLDEAFPAGEPQAAPEPDAAERRDLLRALDALAPRDRQLLWLAHIEQLSHREIAQVSGLASTSVRVLLFRARQRLAERLKGTPAAAKEKAGK